MATPSPTPIPIVALGATGTGLAPWWSFTSGKIPGIGTWLLNVATLNLMVQVTDMAVPHHGVALDFVRTYNEQDQRTDFGGPNDAPSVYGNSWTNNFDVRLIPDGKGGIMLVDGTGAHYDYAPPSGSSNCYTPPVGVHAQLCPDGTGNYQWTQVDGTVYSLFGLTQPSGTAALAGKLHEIFGRDSNTHLALSYTWNGNGATTIENLATIAVTTDDGSVATLTFSSFTLTSGARTLLSSLTWPDGTVTSYAYGGAGNLIAVSKPGEASGASTNVVPRAIIPVSGSGGGGGSGTPPPSGPTIPPTTPTPVPTQTPIPVSTPTIAPAPINIVEGYTYNGNALSGESLPTALASIDSPVWESSGGTSGAFLTFANTANGTTTSVSYSGFVNLSVGDGFSSGVMQPSAPTGLQTYRTIEVTPNTAPGQNQISDSDGHQSAFAFDLLNRVTQSGVYNGSTWLVTNAMWDANNNLVSIIDPRGANNTTSPNPYETDIAYDANGNPVAIAAPSVTTSQGTFRPTKLLSYDTNNNVVASCDEVQTNTLGLSWTGSGPTVSDSLCPAQAGSTIISYTNPSTEPFGRVSTVTTPKGYQIAYQYNAAQEGGTDFGLPTSITGGTITQADGTSITPQSQISYDAQGHPICTNNGVGTTIASWSLMGRLLSVADPDDASTTVPSTCSKTAGLAGSGIVTTYAYAMNGALLDITTPSQVTANGTFPWLIEYDADGNTTITDAGEPGATQNFYDGDDRLIEVKHPTSSGEPAWITRYLYDIEAGAAADATLSGVSATGHGNLFAVQKNQTASGYLDTAISSYDILNRVTTQYSFEPCPYNGNSGPTYCNNAPVATTNTYDAAGALGFLTSSVDPLSVTKTLAYDALGRFSAAQYSDGVTPALSYEYDPDGRAAAITLGTGTQQYTYDTEGHLTSSQEPSGSDSALISYGYYANGSLASLGVSAPSLTQANLFQYDYRADGAQSNEIYQYASQTGTIAFTYTNGGRLTSQTDPTSTSPTRTQTYDSAGRVSGYSIPAGSYSGLTYDALGSLTGYTGYNGVAVNNTYSVREELLGQTFIPSGMGAVTASVPLTTSQGVFVQSPTEAWDGRTGATLGFVGTSGSFTYDAKGRITAEPGSTTLSYDDEGRIRSGASEPATITNCSTGATSTPITTSQGGTTSNTWGVSGIQFQSESPDGIGFNWHWAGDQLLYTSDAWKRSREIEPLRS